VDFSLHGVHVLEACGLILDLRVADDALIRFGGLLRLRGLEAGEWVVLVVPQAVSVALGAAGDLSCVGVEVVRAADRAVVMLKDAVLEVRVVGVELLLVLGARIRFPRLACSVQDCLRSRCASTQADTLPQVSNCPTCRFPKAFVRAIAEVCRAPLPSRACANAA